MAIDQLFVEKALELNPADKFYLMEQLAQSLDKPDPEIDSAWIEESKKRLDAHRSGQTQGINSQKVIGELL